MRNDQFPEVDHPAGLPAPPTMHRWMIWLLPSLLLALILASAASWQSGGIAWQLTRTDLEAAQQIDVMRDFFARFGLWAPVVYLLMVTVEVVVAPLPGLMLYAPGGVLFGAVTGGAMALGGNILGAGIACQVTRSVTTSWLAEFRQPEKQTEIQSAVERRGPLLIFLLRINPLTSSDLVSYAAGLTRIPVWKVMAATGLAMAPLCFAQAWLAEGLLEAFPQLIYPLLVCCIGYLVAVILIVHRMVRQPSQNRPRSQ